VDFQDRWEFAFGLGREFDRKFSGTVSYEEQRALLLHEDNPRDFNFLLNAAISPVSNLYGGFLIGLSDGSPNTGFTFGGNVKF
jgi:hypothetical protein